MKGCLSLGEKKLDVNEIRALNRGVFALSLQLPPFPVLQLHLYYSLDAIRARRGQVQADITF